MEHMANISEISGAIRKFKNCPINQILVKNIIDSSIWGLSILGIQPWKIVCIQDAKIIKRIAEITREKSLEIEKPFSSILKLTAKTIENCPLLIAAYNNNKVLEKSRRYGPIYKQRAEMAELQCIGGVIQNIITESNRQGLGAVWLDSPTFFSEKEINNLTYEKYTLVAFVAIGYPDEKSKRSKRAPYDSMVKML